MATAMSRSTGKKILHETHRGKFSFAVHIMAQYLDTLPDLRITLDVSHWCNVAETFLEDQQQTLDLALDRTDHIHSRVGFQEGPQVPDPRVPEWQNALEIHARWWDKVMDKKRKQGAALMTVTSEFGAPPYLTLMPFTRQPITSQWDVNVFMMQFLKARYSKAFANENIT